MILVLGIGNVLMGDDALGPTAIAELEARWTFPPRVQLLDAGAAGLDLTLFLDGAEAVIVIDAIKAAAPVGEVRSYSLAQILRGALPLVIDAHAPTLREALLRLALQGRCPHDAMLIGAVSGQTETGAPLSPAVRAALPRIEAQIVRELDRLGATPVPRQPALRPNLWWDPASTRLAVEAGS